MSCRIHTEIDLPSYLLEPGAAEFDAFRAHYPTCPDCSNEVLAWTAIEQALAHPSPDVGAPPWHPEPEALARYAGRTGAPGSEVEAMHRHIETCPSCRTEWRALASFDFAGAMDAAGPRAASAEVAGPASGWLAQLFRGLRLDTPMRAAVAGALVMAVLVLFAWLAIGPERRGPREVERFAERPTPSPAVQGAEDPARPVPLKIAPEVVPPTSGPAAGPAPGDRLLAEAPAPAPAPTQVAAPEAPPAPTPPAPAPLPAERDAVQLVEAATGGSGGRAVPAIVDSDVDEEAEAQASEQADDVLLASLAQMPPPDYAAPAGAAQLAWLHQFGSVRGGSRGPDAAQVRAHAPDHVGLTRSAAPRLWWSLSSPALQPVTITLVDDRDIDPVLELEVEGPHTAGMHSVSLAEQGVELEPGVEYRWFVTLVVDAERPSRNPISAGSIKRVPVDAEASAAIGSADPAELGHALARQGYWYDAYDFFAALSQRHPGVTALGDHRDRLLADSTIAPR